MADIVSSGFFVITIITNVFLVTNSQDIVSSVYCSTSKETWDSARESCKTVNGVFLPFLTGLGVTLEGIPLSDKIDTWTNDTEKVWDNRWNPHSYSQKLCGAYSKSTGHYFVNCTGRRLSLCYISTYNQSQSTKFDKSCFDFGRATSATTTTSNVDTTSLAKVTPSRNVSVLNTDFRNEETTSSTFIETSQKDDLRHHTIQQGSDKRNLQNTESASETGLIIGLSVGICIAVIFVVVVTMIYVNRRNRPCFYQGRKLDEPKQMTSVKNESLSTQRTVNQNKTRVSDGSDCEYAVVNTTNKGTKSGSPSNNNTSYSYAKTRCNQFAKSGVLLTSSDYSFAKETGGFVTDMEHESMQLYDDDYDVTDSCRKANQNRSDNDYNTLQMEDYNTLGDTGHAGIKDNVYNSTTLLALETEYDMTTQSDHITATDSIYNHLDQNQTL